MLSKKALLAFALPLVINSSFAMVQVIPQAMQDLKEIKRLQNQNYVLKNVKGVLLEKSLFNVTPENWFNLSPSEGVEGVRTEETYQQFGLPQSEDIIVAVIDSGVDVNHEDLQGKIWINAGEVPNNNLDDDGNGYIDDVFGWNFIGGSAGMATIVKDESLKNGFRLVKGKPEAQIEADTVEVTRELVRMKKLKARVEELGESLSESQKEYLGQLQTTFTKTVDESKDVLVTFTTHLENYKVSEEILKNAGLATITIEAVRDFETSEPQVLAAKNQMISLLAKGLTEKRIHRIIGRYKDQLSFFYNEDFDPRSIVGDNYNNVNERIYGNNDVIGPDASHGTHVSGSIAAVRDNNLGIKGVATNVKIMAVRVVPNGDERDKDVANGIRYAVNNGAKIINMSFGKAYSPYKGVVDDAVKYAESKGVLLVHAAGNDNKNNDLIPSYPSRMHKSEKREFKNWLEIGASSFKKGLRLPAVFSNFGKKTVDFFAPGVDILSTVPNNKYDTFSGTSMATPTTAGVAALVLSYDPSLDAEGVKALMVDTSRRYPKLQVYAPGTESPVLFSSLSSFGSIVDAFDAAKTLK